MCFCRSSTGSEEEVDGNSRQVYGRHGREGGATGPGNLERRVHELEMVQFECFTHKQAKVVFSLFDHKTLRDYEVFL